MVRWKKETAKLCGTALGRVKHGVCARWRADPCGRTNLQAVNDIYRPDVGKQPMSCCTRQFKLDAVPIHVAGKRPRGLRALTDVSKSRSAGQKRSFTCAAKGGHGVTDEQRARRIIFTIGAKSAFSQILYA